jgi:hypothetical protein
LAGGWIVAKKDGVDIGLRGRWVYGIAAWKSVVVLVIARVIFEQVDFVAAFLVIHRSEYLYMGRGTQDNK